MKKILIPCDFSEASENALNYAVELSRYLSAGIVLLHVDQLPVMTPEMSLSIYPPMQDLKQESLDALKNLAGKIRISRSFEQAIDYYSETGNTPDVILDHAEKLQADLVVMGISGHGSQFMKNLVGSSAIDVSKKINVPLIIVPPGAAFKKIRNIAYACDFRSELENNAALIRVKYLATVFAATLQVLHILPEGHKMTPEETGVGNFVERSLENSPHKTYVITESRVAQGLLHFLGEHAVDMIIVEPRRHSFFHKLFSGSTTSEVVFNSPVPVLTLREEE